MQDPRERAGHEVCLAGANDEDIAVLELEDPTVGMADHSLRAASACQSVTTERRARLYAALFSPLTKPSRQLE